MTDTQELPVELAKAKLSRTSEARRLLVEEHSSSFKWMMASLLAINAGGMAMLANLSAPSTTKIFLLAAGLAFWIGIVAALGVAWRGQAINRRAANKLSEIELFWTLVTIYGRLDQERGQALDDAFAKISTQSAKIMAVVSLAAFSFGSLFVGLSLQ